jgi:TPR repeat protein
MKRVVSQTAALHIAFWQYDPWYRRAWFIWPQATAILLVGWLLADRGALPVGKWATPADCSNASNFGCAATRQVMFSWVDEVARPTIANQTTVSVDRSAFRNSAAVDQPKLSVAVGAYYRREWAKAVDILKSATPTDPNVQYLTALALLIPGTTDQVRDAQTLLRTAVAAGHRQAAAVLGHTLFVGSGGLPKDEAAGRKLIEDAAGAGDTYAMRVAAAGYVDGEFGGTYDSVKAVDRLRRAADAGDPIAMAQLAYCIKTGRGGLTRDDSKVLDYLRRSAEAGYLRAQYALGRWFTQRYINREIEDPSEGIKWSERAYQRGYSFGALVDLAYIHRYARAMPWLDTKRAFELLQLCASYKYLHCQYWLARAYRDGAGTQRDLVKAYAHYTVAQQLGRKEAAAELQTLDGSLQPAAKTTATQLAATISAGLRPMPPEIVLQSPEVDSAGPSPWASPTQQPPVLQTAVEIKSTAVVDHSRQVDFLYNLNPDCSSIVIAAVRTIEEPQHGKLTVRKGSGFTNYPKDNPREACNRRRSEGMLMDYRPDTGYLGPDSLTVDIINSNGTSQKRHYVIAVEKPEPFERSRVAAAGQQVQVAFLTSVEPDCSSTAFASVRVVEEPTHGIATLKDDMEFTSFAKDDSHFECNKQKSSGTALLYRGEEGYTGKDSVIVEVVYANGRGISWHYSIDVK